MTPQTLKLIWALKQQGIVIKKQQKITDKHLLGSSVSSVHVLLAQTLITEHVPTNGVVSVIVNRESRTKVSVVIGLRFKEKKNRGHHKVLGPVLFTFSSLCTLPGGPNI